MLLHQQIYSIQSNKGDSWIRILDFLLYKFHGDWKQSWFVDKHVIDVVDCLCICAFR